MKIKINKKYLITGLWSLFLAGIIVLLVLTDLSHNDTLCKNLFIQIENNSQLEFVTVDSVRSILIRNKIRVKDQPLKTIDIKTIEKLIKRNPYVLRVNVYMTIEGDLYIKIVQKRPIMRIINNNASHYYLADGGTMVPVSNKFPVHVVIANGFINSTYNPSACVDELYWKDTDTIYRKNLLFPLYKLAKYIDNNEFWKSQIDQIYVNEKREFELIPKVGNNIILFGSIENYEEKFENLLVFYEKTAASAQFNRYKILNLKYKNQIVCTKI